MYLTYVGSFPLDNSKDNSHRILSDVMQIPIEYPCYPQLMDFIEQFLSPLMKAGVLERKGNNYILLGDITLRVDLREAINPALWAVEFFRRHPECREKVRALKACVTGPFTLASQIYPPGKAPTIKNSLASEIEYVASLANYLKPIIRSLRDLGYEMINIDEPFLSLIVGRRRLLFDYTPDDILDVLDSLARSIPTTSGIHVCGRISPLLAETLAQSEFSILDHEFADTPENLESYTRKLLEDYDKQLAVGVLSSKKPRVEDVPAISKNIELTIRRYTAERVLLVKPDCGFRGLRGATQTPEDAYKIALKKLRNLKKARDLIITKYRIELE